jgi:hypothetical protein
MTGCTASPWVEAALEALGAAGPQVAHGALTTAAAIAVLGFSEVPVAGAYTQLEPCLTQKNTLQTLNTP